MDAISALLMLLILLFFGGGNGGNSKGASDPPSNVTTSTPNTQGNIPPIAPLGAPIPDAPTPALLPVLLGFGAKVVHKRRSLKS